MQRIWMRGLNITEQWILSSRYTRRKYQIRNEIVRCPSKVVTYHFKTQATIAKSARKNISKSNAMKTKRKKTISTYPKYTCWSERRDVKKRLATHLIFSLDLCAVSGAFSQCHHRQNWTPHIEDMRTPKSSLLTGEHILWTMRYFYRLHF